MSRALAASALALLVLLPTLGLAVAEGKPYPEPEYPAELVALVPALVEDARSLERPADRGQPWWPEAEEWLSNATQAGEADRFRVVLFDLETYSEILLSRQLMDEARALPNDAERKAFVIQRTTGWKQDADRAWEAYRARLHGYDGQIRSLHTAEMALFSADLALTSALTTQQYALFAREFPKSEFEEDYVETLVRYSHTPAMRIAWAEKVLQVAADREGTQPRMDDAAWANLTQIALAINGTGPQYLDDLRKIGDPVRANAEGTLAVALALAEQRAARLNEMQMQYGDAGTRQDVTSDAGRFLGRRLENTTLAPAREVGLQGVFVSDAIDRVLYTLEFHANGSAPLSLLLATWANLDHAGYVTGALSSASPMRPAPEEENDTPLAAWMGLVALAAAAVALGRRRR